MTFTAFAVRAKQEARPNHPTEIIKADDSGPTPSSSSTMQTFTFSLFLLLPMLLLQLLLHFGRRVVCGEVGPAHGKSRYLLPMVWGRMAGEDDDESGRAMMAGGIASSRWNQVVVLDDTIAERKSSCQARDKGCGSDGECEYMVGTTSKKAEEGEQVCKGEKVGDGDTKGVIF